VRLFPWGTAYEVNLHLDGTQWTPPGLTAKPR
jgi:hypothetical protein